VNNKILFLPKNKNKTEEEADRVGLLK